VKCSKFPFPTRGWGFRSPNTKSSLTNTKIFPGMQRKMRRSESAPRTSGIRTIPYYIRTRNTFSICTITHIYNRCNICHCQIYTQSLDLSSDLVLMQMFSHVVNLCCDLWPDFSARKIIQFSQCYTIVRGTPFSLLYILRYGLSHGHLHIFTCI
jgi:hypothetical protein